MYIYIYASMKAFCALRVAAKRIEAEGRTPMSGSNDCDPCLGLEFNVGGSCARSCNPWPLLLIFPPSYTP